MSKKIDDIQRELHKKAFPVLADSLSKVESFKAYNTCEDAIEDWENAQILETCTCSCGMAPCPFCVSGFSLPLDEYLEGLGFTHEIDFKSKYDQVMKDLFD